MQLRPHRHALVASGLLLAPEEQGVLGRELVDRDVLDLEAQNDGPDQTEGEHRVAVDNVLWANVLEDDLGPGPSGARAARTGGIDRERNVQVVVWPGVLALTGRACARTECRREPC